MPDQSGSGFGGAPRAADSFLAPTTVRCTCCRTISPAIAGGNCPKCGRTLPEPATSADPHQAKITWQFHE